MKTLYNLMVIINLIISLNAVKVNTDVVNIKKT